MNREVLINIINRGRIRFIPVRRCFLCNEQVAWDAKGKMGRVLDIQ